MKTNAVLFEAPQKVDVRPLPMIPAGADDVIVEALWSGISTGTEKRLFEGTMPFFPGLSYPLVPGYETVGRVVQTAAGSDLAEGDLVMVPGSRCFDGAAGLFGATASRLIAPAAKVVPVEEELGADATLLTLAATAFHALNLPAAPPPDLIIGHGVLGRLAARILLALGHPAPVIWETNPARRDGAEGYTVSTAEDCGDRRFACVLDASGTPGIIDLSVRHLQPGGTIVLAGFYDTRLSFEFAPAFMREARIAIAAEFRPADLIAVHDLVRAGKLSLAGLITHTHSAEAAPAAYETAFGDPGCVKMILDWRGAQ
ncbi:chlorophyll synthesis pathway protein BchC [Roseibium aquae]|uniref:Chlorophyll synthesis pathway protein BchC n=1 Tax=Roseibium aquae TaxID=1323746 RepID=A0A916T805_9HYPH|nr:chlorophyll synthesis pathway protein BchC [Roseibium aquae]GGB33892.1 chlorophyll synthesis pathway protein BchC [Roseibium aquae]